MLEQPIETDRLILREFIEDDFAAVREYASNPEVARFVRHGPTTEDVTRFFLQKTISEQKSDPQKRHDAGKLLL